MDKVLDPLKELDLVREKHADSQRMFTQAIGERNAARDERDALKAELAEARGNLERHKNVCNNDHLETNTYLRQQLSAARTDRDALRGILWWLRQHLVDFTPDPKRNAMIDRIDAALLRSHPLPEAGAETGHEVVRGWEAYGSTGFFVLLQNGACWLYNDYDKVFRPAVAPIEELDHSDRERITNPARLAEIRAVWDAWKAKQPSAPKPERYWVQAYVGDADSLDAVKREWRWVELTPGAFVKGAESGT